MPKIRTIYALLTLVILTSSYAHAANFKITIKAPAQYAVSGISKLGKLFPGKKSGNKYTITIPTKQLAGSSLFLTKNGNLVGPVFAPDGSKARLVFVKSPTDARNQKITSLSLALKTPSASQNYGIIKKITAHAFDKRYKYIAASTPTLGLNLASSNSLARKTIVVHTAAPSDSDGDGVVNDLDADADGDGITNIADSSNDISSVGIRSVSGVDLPFTALYLSMSESLNWHINGALSSTQIDAVVGGENKFSIGFFFSLNETDSATVTGGHVICDSALTYCAPSGGNSVYSGFSDGNQSIIGQLWSALATDGSPYNLEDMSRGDPTFKTLGAGVQPRVGTSIFRPGNNYRVDFTNSSGDVVTSKSLTLPPYFVTAPAIRAYNITSNDAGSDVLVNYSDTSGLGMSPGNPIVLATTGDFAGKIRFTVWRLQRLAVLPDETGLEYRDFGHLNYGVLINNNSGEFTCGGLYSGLSSTLTEVSSAGTGGSFSSQNGAVLWPLVDSSDDYEPSNSSDTTIIGNNTVSFTVDLQSCLARNGLTSGTHFVNLIAAGIDTGHGANRAGQMFSVTIP